MNTTEPTGPPTADAPPSRRVPSSSTTPPPRPGPPGQPGEEAAASAPRPDDPVTRLRGAGVDVDVRRVVPFVIAAGLLALVVAIGALTVAGLHKNDQVRRLRQQGVVVEATVSGCTGLMGGSGSNLVGYDCRASFTLAGHRYDEPLTGDARPVPGSKIRAVTVAGDPALLSTVATVAGEQSSWRVFLAPALLSLVLVVAGAGLLWWTRVRRPAGSGRVRRQDSPR